MAFISKLGTIQISLMPIGVRMILNTQICRTIQIHVALAYKLLGFEIIIIIITLIYIQNKQTNHGFTELSLNMLLTLYILYFSSTFPFCLQIDIFTQI